MQLALRDVCIASARRQLVPTAPIGSSGLEVIMYRAVPLYITHSCLLLVSTEQTKEASDGAETIKSFYINVERLYLPLYIQHVCMRGKLTKNVILDLQHKSLFVLLWNRSKKYKSETRPIKISKSHALLIASFSSLLYTAAHYWRMYVFQLAKDDIPFWRH